MAKKYGLVDEEGNSVERVEASKKRDFRKALRLRRYKKKRSFGRFDRIVAQYSVKKMTRSPKYPNSRYLRANVKVDRKEVHRLYLKFTTDNQEHRYSKLFVSTNFNLKGMSWLDTGVEVESDFIDVVRRHWKDKLEKLLADNVSEVILCDEDTLNQIKRLGVDLSKLKGSKNLKEVVEDYAMFENTLWMSISVTLNKTNEEAASNKRSFVVEEEMTLQDTITGRIISFLDNKTSETNYSTVDAKALSSNVASLVYSGVKESFTDVVTQIAKKGGSRGHDMLKLKGQFNMADLFKFRNLLEEKGIRLGLKSEITNFNSREAGIDLYYKGARDDILLMLSELNGEKLSSVKTLMIENQETPTHFTVIGPKKAEL